MAQSRALPPDRPIGSSQPTGPCYAALDLGTNNCRLLIATPTSGGAGFRVVEAFSRIVRLGDGLTHTGKLDDEAMDRAVAALKICAEKIRRRRTVRAKAVATAACRSASNGAEFIERVRQETGLQLKIITPHEEAQLSVAGCVALLDQSADAALVVDVGGGSTELSWVDLNTGEPLDRNAAARPHRLPIGAWLSVPVGVVSLADRFPEPETAEDGWFDAMVDYVKSQIEPFRRADRFRQAFDSDRAHLIGTSGAITSLAGMHLGLRRYERSRVDGLWLERSDCEAAANKLRGLTAAGRAEQPCIGPDRADLVLAGAAILEAVQQVWPCTRVRVADRGLREGLLMSLMAERGGRRSRNRRRRSNNRSPEAREVAAAPAE